MTAAGLALEITPSKLRRLARPHVSGAFVLGASSTVDEWNAVGSHQLEALISVAIQAFDFVVIDTPGVLTPAVVVGMLAADVVLIVTSLEFASAKNTGLLLEILVLEDFPLERLHVVANHTMPDTGLDVLDLVPALSRNSIWSVPYDREVVRGSQEGVPVVMRSPGSPASRSLLALATRLADDPRRLDRRAAVRTARSRTFQDRLRGALARLAVRQVA